MFSGTPCQCAGLKHFLGKDYDNLLTVDVICRGVPFPALWESYIYEEGYSHKVTHVNFRSKRKGWGHFIDINFVDQGQKLNPLSDNLYTSFFMKNVSLRPSCSSYKFRFPDLQSDLTLGDALGIKNFAPEMFDKRGVSVVFIYTEKGKNFFDKANLKSKQVNFLDAFKKNPRLIIACGCRFATRKIFCRSCQ